jgi:protein involved in polysaccharide export with SLBB domain
MVLRSLAVLAVALVSFVSPLRAQSDGRQATVLRPGDAGRITVWRQPELSGEFTISEGGTITHPLYRELVVTGMPVDAARQRVQEFLARLESNPQFVVQPLLRVSVGGEVRQPSLYRLTPETTIAEAVALAGGATERGRLDRVRVFRGGEALMVDLTSPQAGLAQQPIRSGDQIFVDRRTSLFRDYIAPAGGIVAGLATLLNIFLN